MVDAVGSLLWESDRWTEIDVNGWVAIAYSTIFGSAIAYGLFFYFASRGNLTSLSSLTFLTPVFALLFGSLFLAESLDLLQWCGVSLTLVSILLINQRDYIWSKLTGIEIAEDRPEPVEGQPPQISSNSQ
jgi:drug/metabolite transporter (DMT)-like permease